MAQEPDVETDLEVLKQEWTPKQKENWEKHGESTYKKLEGVAKDWYLALYRPKKRGDGLMERDHVQIGTPEHYLKKKIEGLKKPMSSIQSEIMATLGVDKDTQKTIDEVAKQFVRKTTSEREKRTISRQGRRLADAYGIEVE